MEMGKGKSSNKKKSGGGKSTNRKTLWTASAFVAVILMVLGGVYVYTKPPGRATASNPAPAKGQLIENKPVLSSALFSGKTALAYKYAAEIPKVIDSQFCYCYCKKDHGHKTLLTCFTSMHGSKCETCMDEVIYAYELYQEGKSLDEIVVAVDKKFYRPYKRHL
jgi:Protein of unknown function with PCYCGC motif